MGKHTLEDEKAMQEYIDRDIINAYAEASNIILCGRKDRGYGLKVSARAKELIEKQVLRQTDGGTIWDLEKYQQDNNTDPYEILNKLFESEYFRNRKVILYDKTCFACYFVIKCYDVRILC